MYIIRKIEESHGEIRIELVYSYNKEEPETILYSTYIPKGSEVKFEEVNKKPLVAAYSGDDS